MGRTRCNAEVVLAHEERDLVARAREGDARAFEELVRPHWQVMFRVACVLTGDAAGAEDAAQEALVKAWRALGRFRAGEPVRPWLVAIAANEARNRRRSEGRRLQLGLRAAAVAGPGAGADSTETAALAAEERATLLAHLSSLPDDAREVLALRFLLGLSEAETAAALDVAPGTVKSRTSRALARLKELYA